MKNIAFIGLGNMGAPMARNLVRAGFNVSVYDISLPAVRSLAEDGARAADSAVEAVRDADVVISMLPANQHVRELYLGSGGVLQAVRSDALLVDCSTIAPEVSKEISAAAAVAKRWSSRAADTPKSRINSARSTRKSHISASMMRPRNRSSPLKTWPRWVENRPSRMALVWSDVPLAFCAYPCGKREMEDAPKPTSTGAVSSV